VEKELQVDEFFFFDPYRYHLWKLPGFLQKKPNFGSHR